MALDLWFREDVARILLSVRESMRSSIGAVTPLDPELAQTYQCGFLDALNAMAIAFGVRAVTLAEPPALLPSSTVANVWDYRHYSDGGLDGQ